MDNRVYDENHILNKEPKDQFIYKKPQYVFEIRNHTAGNLFEVNYQAVGKPKNQSFLRPGFIPSKNSNKSFELSFGNKSNA